MTLTALRVRDLATIADVTLELGPGLNVLTGETGAGKSMLVDALALLLGDRADRAAIRPGAAKAVVEGVFDALPPSARQRLEASGLDAEDQVIIRREVTAEGRSRAWINGSPTTIGILAAFGEALVDLHGQHQTILLLDGAVQRSLLDAFADAIPAARAVRTAYGDLAALRDEQRALEARRDDARRRADWLRHVVDEIDAAGLKAGEEEGLEREAARLGQAGTLAQHANLIVEAIEDEDAGARMALARIERALAVLSRIDPATSEWRERLDAAFGELDELARRAAEYADGLAEDPQRLATVEQRRDVLQALQRKHGATVAEVLATRDAARAELDLLDTADLDLRTVAARIAAAEQSLSALAGSLSALRQRGAEGMSREVSRLLPQLGMAGGEFTVQLQPLAVIGPDGAESVVLMVRLNRGIESRPLAKVASGGELSRVMLALKVVLARHDEVPTLVFDEVDQGIGGEVGTRVGESLAKVAERHQVLVITHLPQIASRADHHLRVAKATRGGVATSDVGVLHGEDRVIELARMFGNADDAAARRLALSLLNSGVRA